MWNFEKEHVKNMIILNNMETLTCTAVLSLHGGSPVSSHNQHNMFPTDHTILFNITNYGNS